MKSLVQSWKVCAFALVVCGGVVFFQMIIDSTLESNTTVSVGECTAMSMDKAGKRARPLYNNLRTDDLILKLTCGGAVYVTAEADPILAWQDGVQTFWCKRQATGIAGECVPTSVAK